jgi:hypothetical protein
VAFVERFQVFFAIVSGMTLLTFGLCATIRDVASDAKPALAAASDVKGSPLVAVAAFPVINADNSSAVLEVLADGSTKTTNISGMTFATGRSCSVYTDPSNSNAVIYSVGNDGYLYYSVNAYNSGSYTAWARVGSRALP